MVSFPYTFFLSFLLLIYYGVTPIPFFFPRHYSLFLAIFSLAVGGFCIGTTEFVAMGLIQEIAHNLKITVPEAGHFISAYALGVVIGALLLPFWVPKCLERPYCFASCCFMVLPMHVQL